MKRPVLRLGFTLIELVIVIVLVGIIAAVVSPIISNQFSAYTDSSRRATLVQEAQTIMQRLEQDLYQAVPNSIGDIEDNAFALLALSRPSFDAASALPAGRYSDDFNPSQPVTPGNPLEVMGCLIDPDDDPSGDPHHVVLFPADSGSALEAWPPGNTNTGPVSQAIEDIDDPCTTGELSTISLPNPHRFDPGGDGSLFNRLYLTQGRVDWTCDTAAATLTRNQSFGSSGDRLVSSALESCAFEFIPGSTYSAPGLLVDITVSRDGERVRLARVFQLVNAP